MEVVPVKKCPLCGTERESHACSNVPPDTLNDKLAKAGYRDGDRVVMRFRQVTVVDPNRKGGSW